MVRPLSIAISLLLLQLGAAAAQPAPAAGPQPGETPAVQCKPGSPAVQALERLIRAYEAGDVAFFQERLLPDLPGLGFILDDVARQRTFYQTRMHLTDLNLQCGPDVTVIEFSWARRWIDPASGNPRRVSGRSSVLLSGLRRGMEGPWRLSGIAGDNLFAPTSSLVRP